MDKLTKLRQEEDAAHKEYQRIGREIEAAKKRQEAWRQWMKGIEARTRYEVEQDVQNI
jgi:hypothetical protein